MLAQELEKVASAYAYRAVKLDREGRTEDAIRMYLKAIRILEKLLELRPSLSKLYSSRLTAYKRRVRELMPEELAEIANYVAERLGPRA